MSERERLVRAFAGVATENGFDRTSAGLVAEAADLPEDAFHRHFPTMEDCFMAYYAECVAELRELLERAYHAQNDWRDGLEAALRAAIEALASDPERARLLVVEINSVGPRAARARAVAVAGFRQFFAERPELPPLPDVVRKAFSGGIYTTIYNHVAAGRAAELRQALPALSYFVLLPFSGSGSGSMTK
ncbi:TetR/AcrR family transcriptional regulator [Actinocorallia longicatena]|uniref:HTH tetR-type domain-containing protein n=1 Tax=Actinocorallia longicatena TaxID=111803 RepID=A0ABP6QEA6_9ACTN